MQGNHDRTLWNKVGFNVVRAICRERDDLNYLGPSVEDLELNNIRFRINHGKGAPRKNMGGKLKALIDATPSDEQPDVYLLGCWELEGLQRMHRVDVNQFWLILNAFLYVKLF